MSKQHGFSMIEVMVAVVVLVFGVLGMVGLQMQAINASEQGRYNGVAAMQATSIAAVMKANPAYWGAPPTLVKVQGTTLTGGPASSTTVCTTESGGAACTAGSQMAYYDLQYWGGKVAGALPVGRFEIACDSAVFPAVCTVTVFWKEKNVAGRSQGLTGTGTLATGSVTDRSYQTLVSSL